jgi:UPF0755 protein
VAGVEAVTEVFDDEAVEYEPFPELRSGKRRTVFKVVLGLAVAVLVLAAFVGVWAEHQISPGSPGPLVDLTIPQGSTTSQIASILERQGVIKNATLFRLYVKWKGAGPFQAGSYQLHKHDSYDDVLKVMGKGAKVREDRITIPEGLTLAEIAQRVGRLPGRSADKFLQIARSGEITSPYQPPGSTNLEGLLFPSTYELRPNEDERAILTRMVNAFVAVAQQNGLDDSQAKVGLTPYQVVIVASMIEREARVPSERGMVARVVYNRLAKNIKLGIDATIRYGIDKPTGALRESELAKDTPYNTRIHAGLPPTPIANAGEASLQAALNPTPGPWLFYVLADADGHHAFVTTDAEFQKAVQECRAKGLC